MRAITTWIFLALTSVCLGQKDEVNNAFAKANQAYTTENYERAVQYYKEVLKSNMHSLETHFNLANAHYKLNQVGPAIYHYEKALQIDPDNKDVINNLSYAHQMRIDAVESLPENQLNKRFKSLMTSLNIDQWAWVSIFLMVLAVICYILYYYSAYAVRKRLFFVLMILSFLSTLLVVAATLYWMNSTNTQQYAIVYETEFTTREEPKNNAAPVFEIHAGTKVLIIEEYNDWAHISLANGTTSWMPLHTIKKL